MTGSLDDSIGFKLPQLDGEGLIGDPAQILLEFHKPPRRLSQVVEDRGLPTSSHDINRRTARAAFA